MNRIHCIPSNAFITYITPNWVCMCFLRKCMNMYVLDSVWRVYMYCIVCCVVCSVRSVCLYQCCYCFRNVVIIQSSIRLNCVFSFTFFLSLKIVAIVQMKLNLFNQFMFFDRNCILNTNKESNTTENSLKRIK